MDFRADLHCHSTCSDGTFTPEKLLAHAIEIGLSGISITDHDSVEAYHELKVPEGIEIIPGVEFSTTHLGENVHLLGYAFNVKDPAITALCLKHQERRRNRNREILHLLENKEMKITEEELIEASGEGSHTLGRPHIAIALIKKGYVASIEEAFKKYLSEGSPCYARGTLITIEETIEAVHAAGGLVVIAHPHLIKSSQVLHSLLTFPFDGIECYYSRFQPPHEQRWLSIAKKKNWLVTGGSDFHGTVKPMTPLGCSWVPEETFRHLQNHHLNLKKRS